MNPASASERLPLLDALRGFAIGGVFLSNLIMWHSGGFFLPPERMKELMSSPVNMGFGLMVSLLVFGRFVSILTFMFGLGFMIQAGRAEERGESAGRLHARRLGAMLLIGLAHMSALWYGDFLHTYAVLGFSLLLFRRLSPRSLLAVGLALVLVGQPLVDAAVQLGPRLWTAPEVLAAQAEAEGPTREAWKAATFASIVEGSFLTLVRTNLETYRHQFLQWHHLGFYVGTLGKYLLGAWAARVGLLHDVPRHRRALRRLLAGGLALAVLAFASGMAFRYLGRQGQPPQGIALLRTVQRCLQELGAVGVAAAYVAAIALLFQRPLLGRALRLLAPAGRMALTNYLGQSVVYVLVFTGVGLGLLGQLGPAACTAMVVGLYSLQILVSHLWLSRFRFGPAEWLWRSLSYGRVQPMRREAQPIPREAAPQG